MRRKFSFPALALTAIVFLLSGLLVAAQFDRTSYLSAEETTREKSLAGASPQTVQTPGAMPGTAQMLVPNFADIAEAVTPGIVNISTTKVVRSPFRGREDRRSRPSDPFEDFFDRFFQGRPQEFRQQSLGSGFVIDESGYILTNNHVIDSADEIIVTTANEREYRATVVGKDEKTDIALIKIDAEEDLLVLPRGNSDDLRIAEWVMAIGNPFGLQHTVTVGIVSAKGRVIGAGPYDDFIQVDASINPGNSGGPLIGVDGSVVGVNTAIYSNTGQSAGIGFAIPINIAMDIAHQLRATGTVTRGWLGVLIQRLDPDLARSYGVDRPRGALISKVVPGGPAEAAGLVSGDLILTYGDRNIDHHSELPVMVANTAPGEQVELQILRDGDEHTLTVTIKEMEKAVTAGRSRAPEEQAEEPGRLGLRLQELPGQLAAQLGIQEGVLVSGVEQGSIAEEKGIQHGDVVMQLNGQPVRAVEDFVSRVRAVEQGDVMRFLMRRDSNQYFVAISKP